MVKTIKRRYIAVFTMLVAMALLGVLAGSSGAASEDYTVTDLGTLGGTYSYASGVNDGGQVVGYSSTTNDTATHAFLYPDENNKLEDLGTLGGSVSYAYDINEGGQVVGEAYINNDADNHAFLYDSTKGMQDLNDLIPPDSGWTLYYAGAINTAGQIVGGGAINGQFHAFLYENGQVQDLGTLGQESYAIGINDGGQVVGYSSTTSGAAYHAFLYPDENNKMEDLGTLGGQYSYAYDINEGGQVVGDSYINNDATTHAFLYPDENNKMQDLGTLGGQDSYASGINDSGQVVGAASTTNDADFHAFLKESGQPMIDLNTLIPADSGWNLNDAGAINTAGQIVGAGVMSNGQNHAFLLTPGTPPAEPRLHLPANITREATGPEGAVVTYTATATDDKDDSVAVDCSPVSGTTFPLGTTTVNCSATDTDGNTTPGFFKVTVKDTTPPTITGVPTDQSVQATSSSGEVVTYTSPTANDKVDGSVPVECSPASGATFPVGTTTVNCSATDTNGNSANGSFKVTVKDTTPPETTITSGPSGPTNDTTPTFSFSGSDNLSQAANLLYSYKVDSGQWSAYSSETSVTLGGASGLSAGLHTFYVKAKDEAGNEDASPAQQSFTVDTPPETTIASGPSGYVKSTSASFSFSSSEAGSTFQCSRDASTFSGCTSPKSYSSLSQGNHTFRVRAIDKAGNTDTSPASRSWFVDTVVPKGTISIKGGAASTSSRSVTLWLTASDPSPASGVASMRFRNGGTTTWSSWFDYSTSHSWTLTAGAGTKTVYVQYQDRAGNNSAAASDTIKFSP
jgi:probable HAF family extracellular repeat protein